MNLGEKIKQARLSKNYSQEQLANLIFVTKQSISKYENNLAKPSPETLKAMEQFLEVDFSESLDTNVMKQRKPLFKLLLIVLIVTNILTLSIAIYQGIKINHYNDIFENRTIDFNGLEVTYIDNSYDRSTATLSLRLHFRNISDYNLFADHMMVSIHNANLTNFYFSETKFNGPWHSTYELIPNNSKTLWMNIGIALDNPDSTNNQLILFYGDQMVTKFNVKY